MSLNSARNPLESAIKSAFLKARSTGKSSGEKDESDKILNDLSKDLAEAIHKYVLSAEVDITKVSTVTPPGQAVQVVVPSGTGATSLPAPKATHTGFGQLK